MTNNYVLPLSAVMLNEAKRRVREGECDRLGQALFDVLYELDPISANSIAGTSIDPYNAFNPQDYRVQRFCWWIENSGDMTWCPY